MSTKATFVLKGFIRKLPSSWVAHIPILGIEFQTHSSSSAIQIITQELKEKYLLEQVEAECDNGEIILRFESPVFFKQLKTQMTQYQGEYTAAELGRMLFQDVEEKV